jgi:hypothetical protein
MNRKRLALERSDLAAYSTTELRKMVRYLHRAGELLSMADIASEEEPPTGLEDLGEAITADLLAINRVVGRIAKKLGDELRIRARVVKNGKTQARPLANLDTC